MEQKILEQAVHFEGQAPESWELIGMRENEKNRLSYYRTPQGGYRVTHTKRKQQAGRFEIREDEQKRLFARKVYKRKTCV